jgi:ADP-heptose:LPS heptosyltransferase
MAVPQITIVHQGALGDTMLLIPLFRALRARRPGATITVVTRTNLGQMLTMLGFVDGYTSADDRDHTRWFAPPADGRPNSVPPWATADLLISAVSTGADAWAENARLARQSIASQVEGTPSLLFFDPRPPADFAGHVTDWHRRQLATAGLTLPEPPPPPPRVNPDGAIVIHPGSGGDAKCWPRERFLSLGRALKRNGIVPTFILGEAEQERWGHKVVDGLKDEFPWYLHMGLYELAERMGRARLYLGNDSGVSHVAAAMAIPVIALFGPSNDTQWRPIGPAVKVLRAPPPDERALDQLDEATVLGEMLAELRKL